MINSSSSVVTFLMVFLIQSAQNRDAQTMQMKVNELARVSPARNIMVDLENCSEEEIKEIRAEFTNIRARISAKNESNKRTKRTKPESQLRPQFSTQLSKTRSYGLSPSQHHANFCPLTRYPLRLAPFRRSFARVISSDVSQWTDNSTPPLLRRPS